MEEFKKNSQLREEITKRSIKRKKEIDKKLKEMK